MRTIATFSTSEGNSAGNDALFGRLELCPDPRPLRLAGRATVRFAYLEVPSGAKIELVQR